MKTVVAIACVAILILGCDQAQTRGTMGPCPCAPTTAEAPVVQESVIFSVASSHDQVESTVDTMRKMGFKEVSQLFCGDEVVKEDIRKVSQDGKTYNYEALVFSSKSGCLEDRTAAYRLESDKVPADKLSELLMVLEGKIPHNDLAGTWLPTRRHAPAVGYIYGRSGANAKVETVKTLADGRVIKHVTQDGITPYFAVETTMPVKKKSIVTREVQGQAGKSLRNQTRYVLPTEAELREQGVIPEGGRLLQVIATTNVECDNVVYETRTLAVEVNETVTMTAVTIYPYNR